jgi:hypothetical protein
MWACSKSVAEGAIILRTEGDAILIRIYATHNVEFEQRDSHPLVKLWCIEDCTLKLKHMFWYEDEEIRYSLFQNEQRHVTFTATYVNFENAFATAKQLYYN